MMYTRLIDGGLHVHLEIDYVDDHLQNRVDDRPATGTACHKERLLIFENNRRRHGTQHSLAGLDQIWIGSDEASRIRYTGVHVEIMHFVVQQKTCTFRYHSRAVQILEGIRIGDSVTLRVNDRKMCRARTLSFGDDVFTKRNARRRMLRIDICPQRVRELFRCKLWNVHSNEVSIIKILRSRIESDAHRFRQEMDC